ncbi:ABC transporter ATP-binding protein [Streptomyces sp. NPDC057743]|uniref:ABC transporter ATP-binding protein n=1 Tax=Streptomyces sp. NPDC057743 TaxID=3346236 RepID=UPI003685E88A
MNTPRSHGIPPHPESRDDTPRALSTVLDADLAATFATDVATEAAGLRTWQIVRRLPRLLRRIAALCWAAHPRATAGVLLAEAGAGCATALGLLATRGILSHLFAEAPTPDRVHGALPALLAVALWYTVRGALVSAAAHFRAVLVPAVQRFLEERLCRSAVEVELAAFEDAGWHDLLNRVKDRGMRFVPAAAEQFCAWVGSAVTLLGAAAVLGALDPLLLPLLTLSLLPQAWGMLSAARLEYANGLAVWLLRRRLRMSTEPLTDPDFAAEIRACTAREALLAEYRRLAATVEREEARVGLAQARRSAVGRALGGIGTAASYTALGGLLATGALPLSLAGAAVLATKSAQAALIGVIEGTRELFTLGLHVEEFTAFLRDSDGRSYLRPGLPCPPAFAEIQVRDLTFAYPGTSTPALREVSFTIRRGEVVALVGENGSGKSTLAKLLAGLYRPTQGTICWDGQDIAGFAPQSLHERVAFVMQSPARWPSTARDNITIGRHDRTDPAHELSTQAAITAGADRAIASLSDGYRTLLSKKFAQGCELSGGEWQRIAVARGYFRDAPLLFFDEPTSAMDARAEARVIDQIRRLADDRTVLIITHRLANARHCDRILVLHRGRLVEQGTHDELLTFNQRYAAAYELQRSAHS